MKATCPAPAQPSGWSRTICNGTRRLLDSYIRPIPNDDHRIFSGMSEQSGGSRGGPVLWRRCTIPRLPVGRLFDRLRLRYRRGVPVSVRRKQRCAVHSARCRPDRSRRHRQGVLDASAADIGRVRALPTVLPILAGTRRPKMASAGRVRPTCRRRRAGHRNDGRTYRNSCGSRTAVYSTTS